MWSADCFNLFDDVDDLALFSSGLLSKFAAGVSAGAAAPASAAPPTAGAAGASAPTSHRFVNARSWRLATAFSCDAATSKFAFEELAAHKI